MTWLCAAASAQQFESDTIVYGADQVEQYMPLLEGRRAAITGNHTSLLHAAPGTFTHLVDTLAALSQHGKRFQIKTLFSPEHGFRGNAAAGAKVGHDTDSATGLPIVSLYGKNRKPTQQQLQDIDIMIFDLQDVGCRFYTYISTLQLVMEACAEKGIPLVVLDRPNPNAHYVDGPVLDSAHTSFVGMRPGTPAVYGMTIGEYARMLDSELPLPTTKGYQLTVVPLRRYTHHTPVTLPVAPSPALRTRHAIALYPSLCLFEGTNVSVGRGTPYPFETVGNEHKIDLRNTIASPKFDLRYLRMMLRESTAETFFAHPDFFDKLAGNSQLRQQLANGATDDEIRASWQPAISQFKTYRKIFLLYPL